MSPLSSIGAWWVSVGPGLLLSTTALLALAEAASRLLERRVGAGLRLWFYLPVLLRIAAPLDLTPAIEAAPLGPVLALAPFLASSGKAHPPTATHTALVGLIYLIGVLIASWPVLRGWWAVRRIRQEAVLTRLPGWALAVAVHPFEGPMVCGLLRPVVILPRGLLGHRDQHHVLSHEAAHVARGDLWLRWLLIHARIALWPVVPVWLAASRIEGLTEIAADARATLGASLQERRAYGEILVALASPRIPAGASPATARLSSFHTLKERIMILQRPVPSSPVGLALGGLAFFSLAFAACVELPGELELNVPGEARAEVPLNNDDQAITGSLHQDLIDAVVNRRKPSILHCYERELSGDPALAGQVVFSFTIEVSGKVHDVAIVDSTAGMNSVADCVAEIIADMVFPEPEGGGVVNVRYPFTFERYRP